MKIGSIYLLALFTIMASAKTLSSATCLDYVEGECTLAPEYHEKVEQRWVDDGLISYFYLNQAEANFVYRLQVTGETVVCAKKTFSGSVTTLIKTYGGFKKFVDRYSYTECLDPSIASYVNENSYWGRGYSRWSEVPSDKLALQRCETKRTNIIRFYKECK